MPRSIPADPEGLPSAISFPRLLSQIRLLGDGERVAHPDAEITNGGFELGVPKEELHRPQVAGATIDLQICVGFRCRTTSAA
jgi:hypothetical protein